LPFTAASLKTLFIIIESKKGKISWSVFVN
jgi:hypothetical protein